MWVIESSVGRLRSNLFPRAAGPVRGSLKGMTVIKDSSAREMRLAPIPARVPSEVLDFLRGLAAVYVLVNHARGAFFAGGQQMLETGHNTLWDWGAIAALQLTGMGTEFVILFFVVSGFAMANSLQYSTDLGSFYLKRIIRIWPPYLAAIGIAVVIGLFLIHHAPTHPVARRSAAELLDPLRVFLMAFYVLPSTPALTPQFWSLPYEVVFYLLCPLVLVTQRRVRSLCAIAIVASLTAAIMFGLEFNSVGNFFGNFLGHEMLFFMVGAMAFHFIDRVPLLGPKWLALWSAGFFAATVGIKTWMGFTNSLSNVCMIVLAVLLIRNLPLGIARYKPTNLGFFSYSIYLFHFAFVALGSFLLEVDFGITQKHMTSYFAWVISIPPILFLCWILYHLVEKHCNAAVSRIRSREKSARLAASA